jgi:tRNA pseudouridine38-40 synthase
MAVSEKLPYDDRVTIDVAGDGFLYNMVRAIVGTLVEVGRGKRDESWPAEVVAARDRRHAGQTAPPHGLMLVSVDYEQVR